MTRQLSFDDARSAADPPGLPPLDVEVIRSAKRKKSSQARLTGGKLVVRIPAWLSLAQEQEMVDHFVAKFERTRQTSLIDLTSRAVDLGAAYDLPTPDDIRWVSNQEQRWGSCTPAHRTIRISDRLGGFPQWVVDYVVVHEMAHLIESNHDAAFWALVSRYPLAERARGFLIAKGYEGED